MKKCSGCGVCYEDAQNDCPACEAPLEPAQDMERGIIMDEEPAERAPIGALTLVLVGGPCLFALGYAIYHIVLALSR